MPALPWVFRGRLCKNVDRAMGFEGSVRKRWHYIFLKGYPFIPLPCGLAPAVQPVPAVRAFLAAFVIMDGDEPGTPECWPESPWAGPLPIMPPFQPAPSSQLVSNTVQNIFQAAKEFAVEVIQGRSRQMARQTADQLIAQRRKDKGWGEAQRIKFRFPSGELKSIKLTERCCCLEGIQRQIGDPRLQFNKVTLLIPGTPEPLPSGLDLRTLLPDHPVLEVLLSNKSFGPDSWHGE